MSPPASSVRVSYQQQHYCQDDITSILSRFSLQKKGTGNREQGTDKKLKFQSLNLSQEKDVFKRCV